MKEAHAAKMFPSWRIAIIWMARRYTIESMYVGQSVQHAPNSKEMIKKSSLSIQETLETYIAPKLRRGEIEVRTGCHCMLALVLEEDESNALHEDQDWLDRRIGAAYRPYEDGWEKVHWTKVIPATVCHSSVGQ